MIQHFFDDDALQKKKIILKNKIKKKNNSKSIFSFFLFIMIVIITILGFFGVSFLVLVVYIKKNMIHVPPNHQAVLYSGQHSRLLRSGWHLVKWPKERLSFVSWNCKEEDDDGNIRRRHYKSYFIPTHKQQLDVCETKAITKNRVTVTINGTLHFKIENVMQVIEGPSNLLGDLSQYVESASRVAISKIDHKDLIGRDDDICSSILQHINEKLKDSGVICTEYLLQHIGMNQTLVKLEETRLVQEKEADLENVKIERDLEILKRREEAETEKKELLAKEKKKRSLCEILSQTEIQQREFDAAMKKQKRDNDKQMQSTYMNNKRIEQEANLRRQRDLIQQKHELKNKQALLDHNLEAIRKELEIEKLKVQKLILVDVKKNELEMSREKSLISVGYTPQLLTAQKIAPDLTKAMQGVERVIVMDGENSTKKVGSIPWNLAMGSLFPEFKPNSTHYNHQLTLSNNNNNSTISPFKPEQSKKSKKKINK